MYACIMREHLNTEWKTNLLSPRFLQGVRYQECRIM